MKLNVKRTLLIGFAFLSICSFWQLYDAVIPLILKNTFHLSDTVSGMIMAIDNILALFLLPLFGRLSDATSAKIGKRMPFIIGGTAAAVIFMNILPTIAIAFHKPGVMTNTAAVSAVVSLPAFMTVLGLLLVSMSAYRSPAVALMPDLTPKPLRSKGNAIINLMGTIGAVITLLLTKVLVLNSIYASDGTLIAENVQNESTALKQLGLTAADVTVFSDYRILFAAVSVIMLVSVILLLCTIRENKLREETELINAQLENEEPTEEKSETSNSERGFRALSPDLRRSLFLILFSVFFWFMGYNAVTTAFTKFVNIKWHYSLSGASTCLLVANAGGLVSFLPIGVLSSKIGRKKVIQIGVAILTICFFVTGLFHQFHAAMYIVFALIGCAWAMINVNSYPMVVEISKSADIGKFTGYYYAFSMAAQIITPIFSGWLLEHFGYNTLMPYGAMMVAISFITISLARHGNSKPITPKSKLEAFQGDID